MFDPVLTMFSENPVLFYLSVTCFGMIVGSFLNVVAYRFPIKMTRQYVQYAKECLEEVYLNHPATRQQDCDLKFPSKAPYPNLPEHFTLSKPRSNCPKCHNQIAWYDNIPVLSYFLLLGGKCRYCKTPISPRYPIVEAITGLISFAVAYHSGVTILAAALLIFSYVLIALTLIDFDTQFLPDEMTLPLIWLGLLFNIQGNIVSLDQAVWGAIVGYMSFWTIFQIHHKLTGKIGMGGGDFKLMAALGAWLGLQALLTITLLSSILGIFAGMIHMRLQGKGKDTPFAFGPYLAIAGWITALYQEQIVQVYWGFLG